MNYILSVLLPVYNTELYLERCITSLIDERINSQVEILIVNDGSTDNSLAIANSFAAQYPFIVVVDKPNGGHGSTINKGIEIATGKYFRVLDSDDWFDTEQFVQYVEQLKTIDADAIVTWGYIEQVYANKQLPYTLWKDDKHIEYGKVYDFDTFDFRGKYVVMAQLTYLTSVVKKMPRRLLENTFYVDNEFLLYPLTYVDTIVFLDYYIYHYFVGRPEQSINKKVLKRNIEHCGRVGMAILDFFDTVQANEAKKKYMYTVSRNVIRNYYVYLLSYFYTHRLWAYRLLKQWDSKLKMISPLLYAGLQDDLYIKLYRNFPFLGTLISPYLHSVYSFFKGKYC